MKLYSIAKEGLEQLPEEVTVVVDAPLDDPEVVQLGEQIDEHVEVTQDALQEVQTLEVAVEALRADIAARRFPSSIALASYQAQLNRVQTRLGMPDQSTFALEGKSDGEAAQLVLESLSENIKLIIQKVIAYIKKAWEWVKAFFVKLTQNGKKIAEAGRQMSTNLVKFREENDIEKKFSDEQRILDLAQGGHENLLPYLCAGAGGQVLDHLSKQFEYLEDVLFTPASQMIDLDRTLKSKVFSANATVKEQDLVEDGPVRLRAELVTKLPKGVQVPGGYLKNTTMYETEDLLGAVRVYFFVPKGDDRSNFYAAMRHYHFYIAHLQDDVVGDMKVYPIRSSELKGSMNDFEKLAKRDGKYSGLMAQDFGPKLMKELDALVKKQEPLDAGVTDISTTSTQALATGLQHLVSYYTDAESKLAAHGQRVAGAWVKFMALQLANERKLLKQAA